MSTTTMMDDPTRAKPNNTLSTPITEYGERIRQLLGDKLRGETSHPALREELEAHLAHMPGRYWKRVDESALRWHMAVIRTFFVGLANEEEPALTPAVAWRHFPDRGYTEIALCSWDRVGLLAKVAGAFAEADLNILRADIYTRSDDLVLDIFHVCGRNNRHVEDESRLQEMKRILESYFDVERDLAVMAHGGVTRRIPILYASQTNGIDNVVVEWLPNQSPEGAPIEIQAPDRVGLLHTIFQVLADRRVSVVQAIVTTDNGIAGDVFFLTDRRGNRLDDPVLMAEIREKLLQVLSG
jgi:[protein-PII] uridylyltransferase